MAKVKKVTTTEINDKPVKAVQLSDNTLVIQKDEDIEELLYNAYFEKFTNGKTNQKSWIAQFVDTQMDNLKKNLKSDPSTALSSMRELNKVVTNTQTYFNSKKQTDSDFSMYLLRNQLFKKQQVFYDSQSKRITYLCGRRFGKSFSIVQKAIKHCLQEPLIIDGVKKDRTAVIIGLTLEKTAAIYWDNIKEALKRAHINTAKIDNGSYIVYFTNGSKLILFGNNSKADRERLRGFDFSFVAIDETQSQQGLLYLYESILSPQLKGTNGDIILAGTAPLSAGTFWEKAINDAQWEHLTGTMEDNPYIPNHDKALQEVLEQNHWKADNIIFRREYLAELCYDTERMIIPHREYYDIIPTDFHPVKCFIGIDYGFRDYSSIAPIIIDDKHTGYLVSEWKQNKTPASEIVNKMKAITDMIHTKYNIPIEDIHIVADSSHQQISQDFYNQSVYNIANAVKTDENYQWARLTEACEIGQLYVQKGGEFDQECDKVIWQWNEERGCVIYKIDEETAHPDIMDSVKYAWNTYLSNEY
jgi:hypothetical protein